MTTRMQLIHITATQSTITVAGAICMIRAQTAHPVQAVTHERRAGADWQDVSDLQQHAGPA